MGEATALMTGEKELRHGDAVEVRGAHEILASLDANGALDAIPFMPEMLAYVGRRFTVYKRVEKICDTIGGPTPSRTMNDTVFLTDLRCDGSAHGGCQAACRIYWKEAWLARVTQTGRATVSDPVEEELARTALEQVAQRAARRSTEGAGDSGVYRCQATEAQRASEPLGRQLRQFGRELSTRNVDPARFARVAARAAIGTIKRRLGVRRDLPMEVGAGQCEPSEPLNLQPGEWVEVKSAEDIGITLDASGFNKGLLFTREMIPYCGRRFRVRERVERIIDERTGEMLQFKNDCIVLEGPVCWGDFTPGRWFCPREVYPYWREAWLRRVEPPGVASGA